MTGCSALPCKEGFSFLRPDIQFRSVPASHLILQREPQKAASVVVGFIVLQGGSFLPRARYSVPETRICGQARLTVPAQTIRNAAIAN